MYFFIGALYVLMSLLLGYMGRNTAVGAIGHFLLALILSPVVSLLLQLMFWPDKKTRAALMEKKIDERG